MTEILSSAMIIGRRLFQWHAITEFEGAKKPEARWFRAGLRLLFQEEMDFAPHAANNVSMHDYLTPDETLDARNIEIFFFRFSNARLLEQQHQNLAARRGSMKR